MIKTTVAEYNWETQSATLFRTLHSAESAISSKKPLDLRIREKCVNILNSLSEYLAKLDQLTNNPLIGCIELYDIGQAIESFDEMFAKLGTNLLFIGCRSIVDQALPSDNPPKGVLEARKLFGDLSALDEEINHAHDGYTINWEDNSSLQIALGLLKKYSLQIVSSPGNNAVDIDKCKAIFVQILKYIEPLRPLFRNSTFKNANFHITVITLNMAILGRNMDLESKLDKLNAAVNPQPRSIRPSPSSSTAGSAQASPQQAAKPPVAKVGAVSPNVLAERLMTINKDGDDSAISLEVGADPKKPAHITLRIAPVAIVLVGACVLITLFIYRNRSKQAAN